MGALRRAYRSLPGRIVVAALATTVVFGLIFGAASRAIVTRRLRRDLVARGAALAGGLWETANDAAATEDLVRLRLALREAVLGSPSVRYVVVIDPAGRLVAHTFPREPSADFVAAIAEARPDGEAVALSTEVGLVHDVAVARSGRAGVGVHVGVPEQWVAQSVGALSVVFGATGGAALGAAMVVAAAMGRRIAGPLRDLGRRADAIARGELGEGAAPAGALAGVEEVDALTLSFERMATSLRESELLLAEAQRQMVRAERMAALGTFAAGAAHSINNPLGGLRACVRLLEENAGDAGRLRRYAALCEDAIGRIERLVGQLGRVGREGAGARERMDLGAVVDRSVSAGPVWTRGRRATVEVHRPPGPIWVDGNAAEIEQAVANLVLNATQASPEGGVVRVATRADPPGRSGEAVFARIVVDDQGPGVPAGLRDRIFEPFFTTKDVGEGTGLGLWVVWGVADRHGGRVEVGDTPGGGARFSICLPVAPAAPRAAEAAS